MGRPFRHIPTEQLQEKAEALFQKWSWLVNGYYHGLARDIARELSKVNKELDRRTDVVSVGR